MNGHEFARWAGPLFRVRVSDPCLAKIGSALKSDHRATFPSDAPGWVDLQVGSEIDVELVFVYIRYAWKFASASA